MSSYPLEAFFCVFDCCGWDHKAYYIFKYFGKTNNLHYSCFATVQAALVLILKLQIVS